MLIVCGQRDLGNYLLSNISTVVPGRHTLSLSGSDTRRRTSLNEFSAILIAGRLPDCTNLDLAMDLSQSGCSGLMVITERGDLYEAHEVLDGTGVTILSKPLSKDALLQAVKLILKVAESGGTVEKAKLMLIHHKSFTEPQAHRYIQKLSMDKRLPREVAAQYVIKALEREINSKNDSDFK
jgi:two-component system, response regulator PdtaR